MLPAFVLSEHTYGLAFEPAYAQPQLIRPAIKQGACYEPDGSLGEQSANRSF